MASEWLWWLCTAEGRPLPWSALLRERRFRVVLAVAFGIGVGLGVLLGTG